MYIIKVVSYYYLIKNNINYCFYMYRYIFRFKGVFLVIKIVDKFIFLFYNNEVYREG